ncbi:MAG: galactitol-1-phosphate 5-dehydrogenase [Clostridia bacterium]|nr:galactitol-1-phosphate 5-dehydrogenase [Clostridia bacterium]
MKKTMKAAVLHAVNDLRYEDVPMPEVKEGEVLLKVKAAGVCGSDIPRIFTKGTYHFPTIPGHEFAGLIVAGDEELVGRKAAVFPLLPCRKCSSCEVGEFANCKDYDYYGSRRDGAFAEYIAIDKRNLILLDDSVSYEAASMCEPGAVARCAVRKCEIKLGDTVVVFGAGPIGLIAAQWARVSGAGLVRIVDISDEKIEFAKKFGFELYDKDRDGEADCVIEGTGVTPGLNNCISAVKSHGTIVLMGNPAHDMTIKQSVYSQILRKEVTLKGTWNSSYNQVVNDWTATAEAMKNGSVKYEELITHKYPLEKCNEALEMMRDKKEFFTKVTFVMD